LQISVAAGYETKTVSALNFAPESSYFPAKNALFRSGAREAAKAKPAKLGLAGL